MKSQIISVSLLEFGSCSCCIAVIALLSGSGKRIEKHTDHCVIATVHVLTAWNYHLVVLEVFQYKITHHIPTVS